MRVVLVGVMLIAGLLITVLILMSHGLYDTVSFVKVCRRSGGMCMEKELFRDRVVLITGAASSFEFD